MIDGVYCQKFMHWNAHIYAVSCIGMQSTFMSELMRPCLCMYAYMYEIAYLYMRLISRHDT